MQVVPWYERRRLGCFVPAISLELVQHGDALALEVLERASPAELPPTSVDERITRALAEAGKPVTLAELRGACRVRNAALCERLAALTSAGHLVSAADATDSPPADHLPLPLPERSTARGNGNGNVHRSACTPRYQSACSCSLRR